MKKIYLSFDDVMRLTQDILRQLHQDNWRPDVIVGITRGGLTPAILLSQYLNVPMFTLDVRLRDSNDLVGPESNLWLAEWALGCPPDDVQGYGKYDPAFRKNILIVDDINDSGDTINWIKDDWPSGCHPADPTWDKAVWGKTTRFAVLYDNEASHAELNPTYAAQSINKINDPSWIVFPWEEWWRRWNPNEEVIR